jgi:TolB protein
LTFSRDGNFVYFVRGGVLHQVPTLGGTSRKLWEGVNSAVTLSPDGERMAFVRKTNQQQTSFLMIANADGSGEPAVLRVRESPEFFTWAPTNSCSWSPDGELIVCVGGDNGGFGEMYPIVTRVSDGEQWPATAKRWNYTMQVEWLSDGSGLMMCAGDGFESRTQLWHVSYPDGAAKRIYNDFNVYQGVSLTANSNTMVSVQDERQQNLLAVDPFAEGSKVIEITKGPERKDATFTFAPDGRIVLETQHGGSRDLWIMDADGRNQQQLTFDPLMETMPRVSPDGRSIIFVSNPGIWKIDIDGSNRRQLSKDGLFPKFSPDGEWIVYTSTANMWTLWRMRADGSQPEKLTDALAFHAVISPDGALIAYFGRARPREPNITIIPFGGGEPLNVIPLKPPIGMIEWTRDGKALTYVSTENGIDQIVQRPIDGGEPTILFKAQSQDQNLGPFHWSPDGRMLYFASGPINRNVVLFRLEK